MRAWPTAWSLRWRVAAGSGADAAIKVRSRRNYGGGRGRLVEESATITAGTWLGVGFKPTPAPPPLSLASTLMVRRLVRR